MGWVRGWGVYRTYLSNDDLSIWGSSMYRRVSSVHCSRRRSRLKVVWYRGEVHPSRQPKLKEVSVK